MNRSHRLAVVLLSASAFSLPLAAQSPRGDEFRVYRSSTTASVGLSDVAVAQNGDFVVAWQSSDRHAGSNVFFRLFRADGQARMGEIRVASQEAGLQQAPRVAMTPDGRFIVAWQAAAGTSSRNRIFARRFAPDGRPEGGRFAVTAPPAFDQLNPDVAVGRAGRFVIVWSESDGDISPEGTLSLNLRARRYRADGRPFGLPVTIEDAVDDAQGGRVAVNAAGDFVIAWQSYGGESSFYDIFVQRFRADGSAFGGRAQVNQGETGVASQRQPAVALADDGRFLVVWEDAGSDVDDPGGSFEDTTGVVAQLFGSDGLPRGENFRVNVFTHKAQENPAVVVTADGGFLIAWTSGGDQDGDGRGVFARSIAPEGRRRGREIRLNHGREGEQLFSSLAYSPSSGRGAVIWASFPEGFGGNAPTEIRGRRFTP